MWVDYQRGCASVAIAMLACACVPESDDGAGDGGGGTGNVGGAPGGGGSGGTGAQAAGGTGGSGGSGGTAGSGGGTAGGEPCTPPSESLTTDPTPGACSGNVAITCDPDTARLVHTTCGAGEQCHEYLLEEYKFDSVGGTGWFASREFQWAGCLPDDAQSCLREFDGQTWQWPDYSPQCLGDAKTYCAFPPLPEYDVPGAQVTTGTQAGYVQEFPCDPGETCREPSWSSFGFSDLKCFSVTAPACDQPDERCESDAVVRCEVAYGFESTTPCEQPTPACMLGCGGTTAQCVSSGTTSCDPQTIPKVCTGTDYVSCDNCLTVSHDCSWVMIYDPNTGTIDNVPGQCAVIGGEPMCLTATTELCDSATVQDECAGNVARHCVDYVREWDCGAHGLECGVANGVAGCMLAGAPTCTGGPWDSAYCSGDELAYCCPPDGLHEGFPDFYAPCVPGHEVIVDCTAMIPIPGVTCMDWGGGFAECNIPDP